MIRPAQAAAEEATEAVAEEVTEAVAEATASKTSICDCRIIRPAGRLSDRVMYESCISSEKSRRKDIKGRVNAEDSSV